MFLLAFYALLRLGEITIRRLGSSNTLLYQDISLLYSHTQVTGIRIHMRHHKHAKSTPTPLELQKFKDGKVCPVDALCNYIHHRGTSPGPLFLTKNMRPVTSAQFTAILQHCTKALCLDADRYTPHSFRIGGAPLAHEFKFTDTQLQRLGRWHSSAFMKYLRNPVLVPKKYK